jgi:hypothetical protein
MPDVLERASVMMQKPNNAWPLELASMLFNISDKIRAPMLEKHYRGASSTMCIDAGLASWVFAPMNRGRGAMNVKS